MRFEPDLWTWRARGGPSTIPEAPTDRKSPFSSCLRIAIFLSEWKAKLWTRKYFLISGLGLRGLDRQMSSPTPSRHLSGDQPTQVFGRGGRHASGEQVQLLYFPGRSKFSKCWSLSQVLAIMQFIFTFRINCKYLHVNVNQYTKTGVNFHLIEANGWFLTIPNSLEQIGCGKIRDWLTFYILSMPISLLSSIFVSTGDSPVSSEHQSYVDPNEAAAGFVCK